MAATYAKGETVLLLSLTASGALTVGTVEEVTPDGFCRVVVEGALDGAPGQVLVAPSDLASPAEAARSVLSIREMRDTLDRVGVR